MQTRIKKIMSTVFNVDSSQIDEKTSPDSLEKWDSLGHLRLVTAIEEDFGVTFTPDEILEMLDCEGILATLKNKGVVNY